MHSYAYLCIEPTYIRWAASVKLDRWIYDWYLRMEDSEMDILLVCLPHFAAMCIISHRNFRSRFSLVFSSLTCVYCLGPLQSTWKLLLYLSKQNSHRSSLGLSWIYTFTREGWWNNNILEHLSESWGGFRKHKVARVLFSPSTLTFS